MQAALDEARQAADAGEIPVGAVVLARGEVIARGQNCSIGHSDPSGTEAAVWTHRTLNFQLGSVLRPEGYIPFGSVRGSGAAKAAMQDKYDKGLIPNLA